MSDNIERAFPSVEGQFAGGPNHDYGMTLRDYFAASALNGMLQNLHIQGALGEYASANARAAYELADAMLERRSFVKDPANTD